MTTVKEPEQAIVQYKPDAPAIYGNRQELDALAQRMRVMLKADEAPNDVMYKAAQICMAHRLMPGEQVHVYKIGGSWVVDTGVDAWKLEAKRQCDKTGDTYYIPTPREMTAEEVKEERGELYDPRDRGAVATLYLASEAALCKMMGIPYTAHSAKGFWRVKAHNVDEWKDGRKTGKKDWKEDTIPQGDTTQDVARRRAIKKVIKMVFSLDLDTASDEKFEVNNKQLLIERIESAEREKRIDEKRATIPPTKQLSSFTEELLDAEPMEDYEEDEDNHEEDGDFRELVNYAEDLAAGKDEEIETADVPEMPADPLGNLMNKLYTEKMTTEMLEYGKALLDGPADDPEADEARFNSVREIVREACGWGEGESLYGMPKHDIALGLMGGTVLDKKLVLKHSAAVQMRTDLIKKTTVRGKEVENTKMSEKRYALVKELGKLIDEATK